MLNPFRFLLGLFCCFVYNASYCQNKNSRVSESFETEGFLVNWAASEKCCDYSLMRSDSVAKTGRYALRVELRRDDKVIARGKRAELRLFAEKTPNVERWYKVSYFLPNDYKSDSMYEILAQWHEMPDRILGEDWRSPPLSLLTQDGKWKFRILWATDPVNTNRTISGTKMLDLGEVQTGRWVEWVFHLHFSHQEDGFLQIWKDGKQIVDEHGPNYYNDRKGPYFKVGMYKSGWVKTFRKSEVSNRVFFIDDIKVGDETYDLAKMLEKN